MEHETACRTGLQRIELMDNMSLFGVFDPVCVKLFANDALEVMFRGIINVDEFGTKIVADFLIEPSLIEMVGNIVIPGLNDIGSGLSG